MWKMKAGYAVLLLAALPVAVWALLGHDSRTSQHSCNAPTLAPAPTGRAPMGTPLPFPTTPPLARPLTAVQALEQVQALDRRASQWDQPWSLNTLWTEPGRITIAWYQSLQDMRERTGTCSSMYSAVEADYGAIWQVAIRGQVQLHQMTMGGPLMTNCNGVTYLLSQRTGKVFSFQGCSGDRLTASELATGTPLSPTQATLLLPTGYPVALTPSRPVWPSGYPMPGTPSAAPSQSAAYP
jgi:hypothetical protein